MFHLAAEEKINKIRWLKRKNPAHFLLSTNGKKLKINNNDKQWFSYSCHRHGLPLVYFLRCKDCFSFLVQLFYAEPINIKNKSQTRKNIYSIIKPIPYQFPFYVRSFIFNLLNIFALIFGKISY